MNIKSWNISTIVLSIVFAAIFGAGAANMPNVGAFIMLLLLPVLVWWGYTLKERAMYRDEMITQRAMERLDKVRDTPQKPSKYEMQVTRNQQNAG